MPNLFEKISNNPSILNELLALVPKTNYTKIIVVCLSPKFTLIPNDFYDQEHLKNYFALTSDEYSNAKFITNSFNEINFAWQIDRSIYDQLMQLFKNVHLLHSGYVLTRLFLTEKTFDDFQMLLNVNAGFIEIVLKEKNELLLYNTFLYKNNNDVLYYMASCLQQFNIDFEQVKIIITGELSRNNTLVDLLKKYIKTVLFFDLPTTIKNNDIENHYYFINQNAHKCV